MTSLLKIEWLLIGLGIGIALGEQDLFIFLFGMSILIAGFGLEFYNEHERHKEMYKDFDKKYNIELKQRKYKTKKFIKSNKLKRVTK